jgi:hypothetical protein
MIVFKPWSYFSLGKQPEVVKNWLASVKTKSHKIFSDGMRGPHSGRIAIRQNGELFLRSTPSEYPAVDSGALIASLKGRQTATEVIIGTNVAHSLALREGLGGIARRKMSDNAIREGAAQAAPTSRGWVAWQRNR